MNQPGGRFQKPRKIRGIVQRENQIEVPSTLDYLPKVDAFVERKLKEWGVKKDKRVDIAISVSEAVTNAVVHGNKNDLSKKVKVSLKGDSSCIEVTVEDEGAGFARECVQPPIGECDLFKKEGRGILIVEALMDKVEFLCEPGKGTTVKMVKFLA